MNYLSARGNDSLGKRTNVDDEDVLNVADAVVLLESSRHFFPNVKLEWMSCIVVNKSFFVGQVCGS